VNAITRRSALGLLSAVPFAPLAVRLSAQARPAGLRRIFPGTYHTLLLEPDGTLSVLRADVPQRTAAELAHPLPVLRGWGAPAASDDAHAGRS